MAYTLQEFRDLVRAQLDTDAEELTDTLLNAWLREGWRFCVNRNRRWPFYASTWSVPVVVGTSAYTVADLGTTGNEISELEAILDDEGVPLRWLGHQQANGHFINSTGKPTHWNATAGVLRLYPNPDNSFTFTALGYREPVEWVGTNTAATSDLPAEFDDAILNWSIGRAFQRQEDGDLGVMHLDQAEVILRQLQKKYMKHASSFPLVLNDGVRVNTDRAVVWNV